MLALGTRQSGPLNAAPDGADSAIRPRLPFRPTYRTTIRRPPTSIVRSSPSEYQSIDWDLSGCDFVAVVSVESFIISILRTAQTNSLPYETFPRAVSARKYRPEGTMKSCGCRTCGRAGPSSLWLERIKKKHVCDFSLAYVDMLLRCGKVRHRGASLGPLWG